MITIRRLGISIAIAGLALAATTANAGHSGLRVPPADTFLLGGDQGSPMMVSGRNVGSTSIAILSRSGGKDVAIATVAPGGTFKHRFEVGETALICNLSKTVESQVSVDFSGSPSSLSMTYSGASR